MSGSNRFFLTCIEVSQEISKVVWYSHHLKNFQVCWDPHSQRLWHSRISRSRCFFWNSLVFSMIEQFSSVAQSCPTLCNPMNCSTPGFPVHHQLPELAQTHVHQVGDAIQSSHPLSSPSPPAFNLIRWPSWSFSISPSNEYSGLIFFRIDWFDLLALQGNVKSLLQHHSSKASVIQHSVFFRVQSSLIFVHNYWKNHSFDYTDLCWQSDVCFLVRCLGFS